MQSALPVTKSSTYSYLFKEKSFNIMIMSEEAETIYERVAKLEDEVASLRSEMDIFKDALRNKIARHEIKMIKNGQDVSSILE